MSLRAKARIGATLAGLLLARVAFAEEGVDGSVIERVSVDVAPARNVSIKSIDVDNRLGDVSVIGRDAPGITLSVIKRAPDAETLERLKVNLIPDADGTIRVSTSLLFGDEARPLAQGVVRIDMTLEVPRTAAVDIRGWNGKLEVRDMTHGATLTGEDAEIFVDDVKGAVSTTSSMGSQRLRDIEGTVVAISTYAMVDLEGVSGASLAASLQGGSVVARRVRSRVVEISTTFGDIRWEGELLSGATYRLRSYNGNVAVLTRGGGFRVNAYSRDGKVDSKIELANVARPEDGRLMGSYGSVRKKPAILEVSSTAGRVELGLLNE